MSNITNLINEFNNQNISLFFENKITSFKPEKDVFTNTVNEDTPYSDPIKIGYAELKNHEELLVFTCEYNKKLTERSAKKQQFEIAKKVLKEDFKDGAIFIFYDAQGNFRFSFIRRNYGEKGNKKYSTWKRYTYYVSPSETNKTFKERIDKCSFNNLDSIQEAFSVEKLTKEFYNELFAWYQWAISDEVGITFPNDTNTSEDDRIKLEEQIIRLITRLLFVWFIKQKKLVPNTLFDTDKLSKILKDFNSNDKNNGSYYNAILQNLFFATLNKEVNEREFAKLKSRDIKTRYRYEEMFNLSQNQIIELFKPIPFLNGGLFECLDKEDVNGVKYFLDGFSRNPTKAANGNFRHRAFIPNAVFFDEDKGIIPLLKRYNFTVEENAPNEVQVALDPELLGKVFENLLGAFNPETKETARKQSGSFYTPREIVEYMVTESLATYLTNHLPKISKTTIQQLLQEEELPTDLKENIALCKQISNTLRKIKILDPACGSGAFPMGILNKLVHTLEKLDSKKEENIHNLKLHLIEECIYGIDIQTIAVQISKLRFFISLVVEQDAMDISKPENNYNVLTLPNLETKFVAANTLIGIQRKKAGDFVGTLFTDPQIETTKQQLIKIRKQHYYAKTVGAKKRLREQDAILRNKLTKLLQDNNDYAPEDAKQFSQWNPYDQNATSPFFDTEWMFGLQEGFDVVIGNPPYINVENLSNDLKKLIFNLYTTCKGRTDIYVAFIEQSLYLLKDKGVCMFIIPYPYAKQKYATISRKKLIDDFYIKEILDTSEYNVFDNATVKNIILNVVNTKVIEDTIIKKALTKKSFEINDFTSFKINQKDFLNLKDNRLETIDVSKLIELKNKLFIDTHKLEDICLIAYGARLNHKSEKIGKETYIFNEFKEGLKPFTEGKNINRYDFTQKGWLMYTPKVHYNPMFLELFENDKIFFINIVKDKLRFAYDSNKFFNSHTVINCVKWDLLKDVNHVTVRRNISKLKITLSSGVDYYYLLGVLNSNLINWYFLNFLSESLHFYPDDAKKLPIKVNSNKLQLLIKEVVIKILENKKKGSNTIELEYKIDIMVYKLYNLTYQEVLVIDPEFSLTQEQYNNYQIA